MFEDLQLDAIQEEHARELVKRLLNKIEQLSAEVRELRIENQRVRDENNRLKGEQGKPDIRGDRGGRAAQADHSSEVERRPKKRKRNEVAIHREEVVKMDRARWPADAQYKGYERVIVQELRLQAENVLFYKEKYYSA